MRTVSPLGSFSLLCVACLTIMVGCVSVPGLPDVARELGVANASSWLVTIPSMGVVVFGPFVGRLISIVGARKALVGGLVLYGAFGSSCVWLEGHAAVFLNRFLLGGATAIVMAAGTTLISDLFDGEARLKMIAKQGMAIELGGVIFLAIGGVLATIGWSKPFLLYLMAWLLIPMVIAFIPADTNDADDEVAEATSSSPGISGMKDVLTAAALSMVAFFAGVILLPGKLAGLGMDPAETGYFLSFVSLVAVGAAFAMPRVTSRIGASATLTLAFVLYAGAHAMFFAVGSLPPLLIGAVCLGAGFGFSVPLVNHLTIERTSATERARMLGYLSSAIFLGQFLSALIELAPVAQNTTFLLALAIAIGAIAIVKGMESTPKLPAT